MDKIADGRFPLASQSESLPWVNTETTFCKYGRFCGPSRSRKIQELVYDTRGKNESMSSHKDFLKIWACGVTHSLGQV